MGSTEDFDEESPRAPQLPDMSVDDPLFVHFRMSERCWVITEGRSVAGTVIGASSNGRSLFIDFEAIIDGHAGGMPVIWDDTARQFRVLMTGHFVKLAREPDLPIDS